ncbi:hypothetical protein ASPFODRAFT_460806 [Aspergillus luchuensis CBS 106.47]|uniref:Condensation domain-containing protein n=1 Tax=Aspergillus luchuensis (strain CBS 106.47) TaxID=1137211 RepID=A0A1M3T0Q9_ASPLC|nr:hypothetical protein ASPFODRAFT_460806 [Aspergillus luchuensis CBS 106.47]
MTFYFTPMQLTLLDQMMPKCYIAFFYSFHLEDPQRAVSILENALRSLIMKNPFLAGNVINPMQDIGNAAICQVHPPTPESLHEFPFLRVRYHEDQSMYLHQGCSGCPISNDDFFAEPYLPVPLSAATAMLCPIIRWQANIMQDGLVITVCFHHSVLDAAGFYVIQAALAKCCRMQNGTVPGLSFTSDLLIGRRRILETTMAGGVSREPPLGHCHETLRDADFESAKGLISRRLTLASTRIEYLKKACNALVRSHIKDDLLLSTNDVISALLWLSIIRARYESNFEGPERRGHPAQSSLILIADIRRTLSPPLPISYIGNGIIQSETSSLIRPVLGSMLYTSRRPHSHFPILTNDGLSTLTDLAVKVHTALTNVTNSYVGGLIKEKHESVDKGPRLKQGDVTSTSLRRMGIYGLDFGTVLGRVVEFDSPDNRIDGTVCILPARPNFRMTSSKMTLWELRVTLQREVMLRLLHDPLMHWSMEQELARL